MAECPNPDCKRVLNGHHNTLFGANGSHGIVGEIHEMSGTIKHLCQKFVSRKQLWGGVLSVVSICGMIMIGGGVPMYLYAKAEAKEVKAEVIELSKENAEQTKDIEHIKEELQKLSIEQAETLNKILKAIKELENDSN